MSWCHTRYWLPRNQTRQYSHVVNVVNALHRVTTVTKVRLRGKKIIIRWRWSRTRETWEQRLSRTMHLSIRQFAASTEEEKDDDDDDDDDPLSAISHASSFDLSLYDRVHRPCPRVGHSLSREWPGESSSAPKSSKEGRYSSILAHFPGKLDSNRTGLAAHSTCYPVCQPREAHSRQIRIQIVRE